jgi:outer membrane protein
MGEDLQQEVEQERNQILAASGQRMQAVVSKLAEEKQLDMVVDVADTIYFRPALDITNDAIAAYDQAHPAN